jgi:hypothetical protein
MRCRAERLIAMCALGPLTLADLAPPTFGAGSPTVASAALAGFAPRINHKANWVRSASANTYACAKRL